MRGQRLRALSQVLLHTADFLAAERQRGKLEQRRWIGRSQNSAELVTEHFNRQLHAC